MINSSKIRDFFPSIGRIDHNNNQIIYLDGPGGTQVPIQVIEASITWIGTCVPPGPSK